MDVEMGGDLLAEILVRLPHKSLARFQCVSTTWRALISADHLRRRLPLITSGVLFHDGPCVAEADDMAFFPCHGTSSIIDGCNGLVLYYAPYPVAFHIVNPITRRWAALPALRRNRKTLLSVLCFDPCASPHYKVACFTEWLPRGARVEVFDSESGTWSEHELDFGLDTDAMSATMHFFGSALHVLAYSGPFVHINLDTMACSVTALPAPVSDRARMGHCRGHLRYATSDGSCLTLWEHVDVGKSEWAVKHVLGIDELVSCGSCQPATTTFVFMAFH
uniref:F-box domain-containing protein n=2 Tax=Aegilops tauschii TaxID=37682 RepID=A0A452XIC0_AEGTS